MVAFLLASVLGALALPRTSYRVLDWRFHIEAVVLHSSN